MYDILIYKNYDLWAAIVKRNVSKKTALEWLDKPVEGGGYMAEHRTTGKRIFSDTIWHDQRLEH